MKKLITHSWFLPLVLILSFVSGAFTYHTYLADITMEDVKSAAKLIGLEMSDEEIEMFREDLTSNIETYQSYRATPIDNSVAPALMFDPRPTGFELPTQQNEIAYSKPGTIKMPGNKDELAYYSVRELAELIKTRQITSVELTKFFLDRLKKYDGKLECVITLTEELALEQAIRADKEINAGQYRGLLHGIPYGAKDLLATKNYKTTWGAMPYKDQMIDMDATVIQKLEEAGAVLCAKLTLGALAMGNVWYGGSTRNPWNTEQGSSGSSAGSASAVSAGLLPFALGTETLGSIVSPSTVCGTTGLRPTFGRVSKHGAMALVWSMDKIGPLTRSAEDCAIVFEAIHGTDGKDLSVIDAPFNYDANSDPKKLRIGYLKSAFDNNYRFKKQDSIALEALKAEGFELIPIELPEMPNLIPILSAEAAAAFDQLTVTDKDDLLVRQNKGAWPNSFRQARFIPAVEYIQPIASVPN